MAEDEGTLRRWSRRKAAGKSAPEAEPADPAPGEADAKAAPVEGGSEAPAEIAPEDLPDIETLEKESDFTPFLREGVPEELRRLALRRLWRLDPVLANLDGLIDYGEDFTDAATVIKGMKTIYQVGRGLVGPEDAEAAEDAETAEAEEAADEAPASGEPSAQDTEPGEAAETAAPAPAESPEAAAAERVDAAAPGDPATARADAPPPEDEPAERRPRTRLSLGRLSGLDQPSPKR